MLQRLGTLLPSRFAAWVAAVVIAYGVSHAQTSTPETPQPPTHAVAAPGSIRPEVSKAPTYVEAFEQWEPGSWPGTWTIDEGDGECTIRRDDEPGRQHMVVKPPSREMPAIAVSSIDARMFSPGWHRLSMRLRQDTPGGIGSFYVQITNEDGVIPADAASAAHPVTSTSWRDASVMVQIPERAASMTIGVIATGGSLCVDDVTIRTGVAPKPLASPPAPLDDQERRNLVALARLWGPLRYFYASNAALHADWNLLTVRAVRAMREAKDDASAMEALRSCFASVCPQLTINPRELADQPAARPDGATSIARMVYRGYADPLASIGVPGRENSIYGCSREVVPTLDAAGDTAPEPAFERVELGNSMIASIPPAWQTASGNDVHTTEAPAFSDDELNDALDYRDRAVRLSAVLAAWSTLDHFYPYFNDVQVDWAGALDVALASAATDPTSDAFLKTLETLVAMLRDGHGFAFVPGTAFKAPLPIAATFIGDELVVLEADEPTGAQRGDVVVSVDGRPMARLVQEFGPRVSASTERFRKVNLARRILTTNAIPGAQPDRSQFALIEFRRPDGTSATSRVAPRPTLEVPTPARPESGAELAPGIIYVNLVGADATSVRALIPKLASAKGLILDVRGYPDQGVMLLIPMLSDQVQSSAAWHVPIFRHPGRRDVEWKVSAWTLPPKQPELDAKVVFLTDASAISYAESVMEIVEHNKLGRIVGEATAGTNGNVSIIRLPGGAGVQFTGMRVVKQNGTCIHGVGVIPTDEVAITRDAIAAGSDLVLERGLEIVTSLIADDPK